MIGNNDSGTLLLTDKILYYKLIAKKNYHWEWIVYRFLFTHAIEANVELLMDAK